MPAHRHFLLYKPYGYLSQFIRTETTRKNKKLLGQLGDFPKGTMAIGRLDEHSEGLIFLTTDGMQSHIITSTKVEKEYYAQVDGEITLEALKKLQEGIEITVKKHKYLTLPGKADIVSPTPIFEERAKKIRDERHGPTSWVSITIKEGKYRQVRKMTAAIGFPTLRLIRVRIGNVVLGDLKSGKSIEIEQFDY
jgi:23S rRNA pseudouridine2457 synthase|tara:strand:- start:33 stop:611 length:579 start_codon:yes stop_codon:yes gene_type:complete